jgi:hypothetical protein
LLSACPPRLPRAELSAATDGEVRHLEHAQSDALTTIGGYAMVYRRCSSIVLSSALSPDDQARGRSILIQRIKELPPGTNSVILWHPDD